MSSAKAISRLAGGARVGHYDVIIFDTIESIYWPDGVAEGSIMIGDGESNI